MKKIMLFIIMLFICFTYYINTSGDKFYFYFIGYGNVRFCYIFEEDLFENKDEFVYKNESGMLFQKNGTKNMVYFDKNNKNILKYTPEYYQAKYYATFKKVKKTIKELKLNIVEQENVEDRIVIYAYSQFWKNFKIVKNRKVNFQLVFYNNVVTVGHPIIYYSF